MTREVGPKKRAPTPVPSAYPGTALFPASRNTVPEYPTIRITALLKSAVATMPAPAAAYTPLGEENMALRPELFTPMPSEYP